MSTEEFNNSEFNPKDLDSSSFKCPNCGANLNFDAKTNSLKCDFCEGTVEFEKDKAVKEIALEEALKSAGAGKWSDEAKMISCKNCGAKEVVNKNDIAKVCPFCGTGNVVETNELSGIKPNMVIPFTVDKPTVIEKVKAWVKKKIFAPRQFKKSVEPENINGVYSPAFTFDSNTSSNYYGILGKYYYVTVGSGKNRRQERKIRWFNVSGTYNHFFDDVTINVDAKIKDATINKLLPFDKKSGCVYDKKFLSGFNANHYEKDIRQSWEEANKIMDKTIRQKIIAKHNADVVQSLKIKTAHRDVTYKYMLIPVYLGNMSYKEKVYNYFVNGNTCKITGKIPLSPIRILIAIGIGIALLGGLIALIALFG